MNKFKAYSLTTLFALAFLSPMLAPIQPAYAGGKTEGLCGNFDGNSRSDSGLCGNFNSPPEEG